MINKEIFDKIVLGDIVTFRHWGPEGRIITGEVIDLETANKISYPRFTQLDSCVFIRVNPPEVFTSIPNRTIPVFRVRKLTEILNIKRIPMKFKII